MPVTGKDGVTDAGDQIDSGQSHGCGEQWIKRRRQGLPKASEGLHAGEETSIGIQCMQLFLELLLRFTKRISTKTRVGNIDEVDAIIGNPPVMSDLPGTDTAGAVIKNFQRVCCCHK